MVTGLLKICKIFRAFRDLVMVHYRKIEILSKGCYKKILKIQLLCNLSTKTDCPFSDKKIRLLSKLNVNSTSNFNIGLNFG